jgi:hypothetical protein
VFFDYGGVVRGVFVSNTSDLHWVAACRAVRFALSKENDDHEQLSTHVFAYNSPVEHEFLLISYFGFLQTYLSSFSDKVPQKEIENLWLELWSIWKQVSQIENRMKESSLLDVIVVAVINGTFMGEVSDTNSQGSIRRSLVSMASTPGTTYILPLMATMFLQFALDELDNENLPTFRKQLAEHVNHGLKPRKATPAPKTPECPDCGKQTVLRYQRQGPNPGQPFWGCSRFPNCRGTLPLYRDPSRYPQFQDDERDETDWFYEYMREVQGPSWDE